MKKLCFLLVILTGISTIYAQNAPEAQNSEPLYIVFPAYTADLTKVGTEQAIQNSQVFSSVAKLLLDNPKYRILVDGHANPVIGTSKEEETSLRPLSIKRAEAAADFLVNYYRVDRKRLIITGAGGIYSFGDSDGAHDRRVSFFVITPK